MRSDGALRQGWILMLDRRSGRKTASRWMVVLGLMAWATSASGQSIHRIEPLAPTQATVAAHDTLSALALATQADRRTPLDARRGRDWTRTEIVAHALGQSQRAQEPNGDTAWARDTGLPEIAAQLRAATHARPLPAPQMQPAPQAMVEAEPKRNVLRAAPTGVTPAAHVIELDEPNVPRPLPIAQSPSEPSSSDRPQAIVSATRSSRYNSAYQTLTQGDYQEWQLDKRTSRPLTKTLRPL